jgi:hypothetical protein
VTSSTPRRVEASLGATLPPGWEFKESLTLLSPDGQANIIVSSEPLEPGLSSEAYAGIQGMLLRNEFPGYVEIDLAPANLFGGMSALLRRFAWTPPDGVEVTQLQLYAVADGRGYTVTATSPSASFGTYEDAFLAAVETTTRGSV